MKKIDTVKDVVKMYKGLSEIEKAETKGFMTGLLCRGSIKKNEPPPDKPEAA